MALTQVTMPQLGESVTEGTIGKWLKKPGDTVEKYESLAEVITDKVNAEIPSPVSGVIKELKVEEGATVPVGTEILAIDEGASGAEEAPAPQPVAASASAPAAPQAPVATATPASQGGENGRGPAPAAQPPADMSAGVAAAMPQAPAQSYAGVAGGAQAPGGAVESEEEILRRRSTPAVRRLAEEHNVDLTQVKGTGLGGRVTREDILQYVANRPATPVQAPSQAPAAPKAPPPAAPAPVSAAPAPVPPMPIPSLAQGDVVQGLTPMRRAIAEHMVRSVHTSPHAWTSVEIDITNVVKYRDSIKESFKQREGVDITYYAFFVKAVIDAIKQAPLVNSTWNDEQGVIIKRDINVGVPVDMGDDKGLIVPVIHGADNYSITGLARRIYELATKARAGKLTLDEIQGGTITINNTGALGTFMTSSIINQPQACLVTLESIVKRPVVVNDMIAIRSMTYSCIALDHRILDGAVGAKFLRIVKQNIENFDPASVSL